MLAPADVLNIKCEFVSKVLAYLSKRRYAVNVCPCTLYPYYARYVKASVLSGDCLDYDDECAITSASSYQYTEPTCTTTSVACSAQATITLSQADSGCTQTAGLCKSALNGSNSLTSSAFPTITRTNNSEYINGYIFLGSTRSGICGSSSLAFKVDGGCTSSGCSDAYKYIHWFGMSTAAVVPYTTYIKTLRVYTTDVTGALDYSVDLDLDPSTSVYYADDITDCPGCSTVLPTEVQFGNANFSTAFETLMDNVSIALFGSPGLHLMRAHGGPPSTFTSFLRLRCGAVHNPSSYWFGINKLDGYMELSNGLVTNSVTYFGDAFTNAIPWIKFYYNSAPFTIPGYSCADLSPELLDQVTRPNINLNTSSFNKIELYNDSGTVPLTIDQSETCSTNTILTATYITTGTVSGVTWKDPSLITISTSNTANAVDPGAYTFTVTLTNGCEISETILVD